jgi:hypothetical protein
MEDLLRSLNKPRRAAPVSDVPPTPKGANNEEADLIDKEELPKATVEVQVVNLKGAWKFRVAGGAAFLLNEGPGDVVLKPTCIVGFGKVSWRHFMKGGQWPDGRRKRDGVQAGVE